MEAGLRMFKSTLLSLATKGQANKIIQQAY